MKENRKSVYQKGRERSRVLIVGFFNSGTIRCSGVFFQEKDIPGELRGKGIAKRMRSFKNSVFPVKNKKRNL